MHAARERTRRWRVAVVVLASGKVNALDEPTIDELKDRFRELEADEAVRAVIFSGEGKFFSFGFDIPGFLGYSKPDFSRFLTKFTDLYTYLFTYPKPVVAALNGHTVAGGLMLALAMRQEASWPREAGRIGSERDSGSDPRCSPGASRCCASPSGTDNAEQVLKGAMSSEEALRPRMGMWSSDRDASAGSQRRIMVKNSSEVLPVAEETRRRELISMEFVDIWYSEATLEECSRIRIRTAASRNPVEIGGTNEGRSGRWTMLLLSVCIAGCSGAPTRPESVGRGDYTKVAEYVSALIRHEMKKRDVTGLSIALVDDQRVVWAEGFGYADKAGNVPASPETVYRAGSISKLFTATAAMQLAERGRLDIDRPLGDYLPGFSIRTRFADAAPVTPRSIMTHHSGLPSDYLKGMWTRNPEPFTRVAGYVRDEYAANPPGVVFSYSNLGVTLLGDAIGKVAGRDFASHRPGRDPSPAGDEPFLLFPVGRPDAPCGERVPERKGGGRTPVARRPRRGAEHQRSRPEPLRPDGARGGENRRSSNRESGNARRNAPPPERGCSPRPGFPRGARVDAGGTGGHRHPQRRPGGAPRRRNPSVPRPDDRSAGTETGGGGPGELRHGGKGRGESGGGSAEARPRGENGRPATGKGESPKGARAPCPRRRCNGTRDGTPPRPAR